MGRNIGYTISGLLSRVIESYRRMIYVSEGELALSATSSLVVAAWRSSLRRDEGGPFVDELLYFSEAAKIVHYSWNKGASSSPRALPGAKVVLFSVVTTLWRCLADEL